MPWTAAVTEMRATGVRMRMTMMMMLLPLNQRAREMSVLGAGGKQWLGGMEGTMVRQDGERLAPWLPVAMMTEVGVVMCSSQTQKDQEMVVMIKHGREVGVEVQGSVPAGDGMP
uniref:Uncharacterized protein n=1 Tax=Arundo donax TaxID=35708 RepID=A0A0A9GSP4_ARUDO